MRQQSTLMKFDPVSGEDKPYPSHADQYRDWHGHSTAWLFNPWTGERRDARCIGSDIVGNLIVPPGEPIYLASPFAEMNKDEAKKHFDLKTSNRPCREYRIGKYLINIQFANDVWAKLDVDLKLQTFYFFFGKITRTDGLYLWKLIIWRLSIVWGNMDQ